jgi:hypothetical protein
MIETSDWCIFQNLQSEGLNEACQMSHVVITALIILPEIYSLKP